MAGKRVKSMKESVIVLCAHSDDQIFGVGGTLAKYAKEGKKAVIVVFSYGEKSHPWLKKKVTVKRRVKESQEAARLVGAEKTVFYGIEEGKFAEQIKKRKIGAKLKRLFKEHKPVKIFTHASDDHHSDHKAINKFVLDFCDKIKYKGDVYSFDVWNPVKLKERNVPRVVVDISDTFKIKIKALKAFESQWVSLLSLLWSVYYRAIKNGISNNCKYAEVFYKIK